MSRVTTALRIEYLAADRPSVLAVGRPNARPASTAWRPFIQGKSTEIMAFATRPSVVGAWGLKPEGDLASPPVEGGVGRGRTDGHRDRQHADGVAQILLRGVGVGVEGEHGPGQPGGGIDVQGP